MLVYHGLACACNQKTGNGGIWIARMIHGALTAVPFFIDIIVRFAL